MPVEIFIQKNFGILVPSDSESEEVINKLPKGKPLRCKITVARNYENHKRFFSFLAITFDMQDHFESVEAYRNWLTMKAGWFVTVQAPNGNTFFLPKSISFGKMDEEEFKKLFSACIDAFLSELSTGITRDELLRVVEFS